MNKNFFKKLLSFAIAAVLSSAFVPTGAFADVLSAQATADGSGSIAITGTADGSGRQIGITVTSPSGELCYITQVTSAQDGGFAAAYKIQNRLNGTYKVSISTYGLSGARELFCNVDIFKNVDVSDIYFTPTVSNRIHEIYPSGAMLANADIANNTNSQIKADFYREKFNQNYSRILSSVKTSKTAAPASYEKFEAVLDNSGNSPDAAYRVFLWNENLTPYTEAAHLSYDDMFTNAGSWYCEFARGIIRPDEGTVEFTVTLNKPIEEFGTGYDFLFSVLPSKQLENGGTNIFGITFPSAPQDALLTVVRDARGTARYGSIPYDRLNYNIGEKFNLAMSWKKGGSIKMYLNGGLISSSPLADSFGDENLPYSFRVCTGEPFNTNQMRICSKELTAEELASEPSEDFTANTYTTALVTDNMQKRNYYTTPWHTENNYSTFVPIMLTQNQCYTFGEDIYCRYAGVNYGSDAKVYRVNIEIANSDGVAVGTVQRNVTVPPDGKYHIYSLKLNDIRSADLYCVKTTVNGTAYGSNISVLAANDNSVPDGKFSEFYGQDLEYHMDSAYVRKLGAKLVRNQAAFAWYTVEPQKGQFNWSTTDEFVKRTKKDGMQCLAVLGKWPHWAAQEPTDDEKANMQKYHDSFTSWKHKDINDWRDYVYQTVSRYKDDVKYWEIINEVNFKAPYNAAAFTGTNEEYAQLLKTAYEAAKEADPDCVILTSGFTSNSSADPTLPLMLTGSEYADGYFDVYNIHGYNGTKVWENAVANLRENNPSAALFMDEYMPMAYADGDEKAFNNILSEIGFMNLGAEKYLNMGTWSDNFLDITTESPTLCYQATGIFQNSIRKCDEKLPSYTFDGDGIFCIKECFKRTDGKYLSIFGSTVGKNIVIEFDGRPAAVYDIYGRKIKGSDGGVNAKVAFNSLVYIVTDEPISVTGVSYDTKNKIANSGFEQTSASGDADGWTKREYGGTAELTDDSYEGEYAVAISNTDSGKSTYIFREVSIDTAGTYTFSAMVKNSGSSAVKVMLRVYDRDGDSSAIEVFNVTFGEYTKIQKDFTINQSGSDSYAFIIGIPQGVGEVTVDNAELVYKND